MDIAKAADFTGVSADMIRFYEKKGMLKPKRRANGYRDFSTHDLHVIILIRQYSALGIPLRTIADMIRTHDATEVSESLNVQLKRLETEYEQAYARMQNARDLKKLLLSYMDGKNWDAGIRPDMMFVSVQTLHTDERKYYLDLINSGTARATGRIQNIGNIKMVDEADVGLLMPCTAGITFSNQEISPSHAYYRVVLECQEEIIPVETIHAILDEMHERGYEETGNGFLYQMILDRSQDFSDTVCVEIEVRKK
ncbi:MAG: MerR family transcriptional regulator [Bulleidia sp.]